MQEIISPVDRSLLLAELTPQKFLRYTNNGNNHVYVITHHDSPHLMREVGRLREITFRGAGGGTNKEIDIDEYDTASAPYKQLIVWNPEDQEVVAGYRFIKCGEAPKDANGDAILATTHLFHFSEKFKRDYLGKTIELGRSFVQPKYQPGHANRKGLFSMDNLWDGLGAILVTNPDIHYFFGKVTMYTHFNQKARDLILYFMHHYFPDNEQLVVPIKPVGYLTDVSGFAALFEGLPYKEGHIVLNHHVRELGENIPPLVNTYMNISSTMKTFGTAINDEFGDVEETGILVNIHDIYESKKSRHVYTYERDKQFKL